MFRRVWGFLFAGFVLCLILAAVTLVFCQRSASPLNPPPAHLAPRLAVSSPTLGTATLAAQPKVLLPIIQKDEATPTSTPGAPTHTPAPEAVRFAVIGDYGWGEQAEAEVAALVKSWKPDFVVTVGDNNYPFGSATTIDENIGQFYHEFIFPYAGGYGEGAETNRFFPVLGNHDWDSQEAEPYLNYFTLPHIERYYDFTWGALHFFSLDSDSREPDGVGRSSKQANWLKERLAASSETWNIIVLHHAPYSSGLHGSIDWMRWPFQQWGADIVLSGNDHTYERLFVDGFTYIVNGLGGGPIYSFSDALPGSQVRYNDDYGAMLVVADNTQIIFQFINRSGEVIDTFELTAP